MSLIKSISGIRGTIGGAPGEGLSPLDIVKYTAAYATFIKANTTRSSKRIVGRKKCATTRIRKFGNAAQECPYGSPSQNKRADYNSRKNAIEFQSEFEH